MCVCSVVLKITKNKSLKSQIGRSVTPLGIAAYNDKCKRIKKIQKKKNIQ
jgi:hypothetical protein